MYCYCNKNCDYFNVCDTIYENTKDAKVEQCELLMHHFSIFTDEYSKKMYHYWKCAYFQKTICKDVEKNYLPFSD